MPHALRDYQAVAVERVISALDRRPCLVAPTGSGKTVMAAAMIDRLGVDTLWLTHRKELVEQAARHIRDVGSVCGIIMAGVPAMPFAPIQVASIQTLTRREAGRASLVVIDEAHHATARTYRRALDAIPGARVVGLTATPFRLDGSGLGDLFGELVVAAYTDELCDAGTLHRPRVYASLEPDVDGVRIVAGDYVARGIAERMLAPKLTADVVQTWQRRAAGKRTVAFAASVAHSRVIVDSFSEAGVPAEHIDGTTPRDERDAILARLASGETLIVSNCMVLTEGWDLPALECAIIARPTASLALHLQMIGRVMRAAAGKDGAIVLDHAGNHHRHGLVTRRIAYSLTGTVGKTAEPLGLRRCRQCGLHYEVGRYSCPECGWAPAASEYPRSAALEVDDDRELEAFDDTSYGYRAAFWRATKLAQKNSGRTDIWSARKYADRFGEFPVVAGGELVDTENATAEQKQAVYEDLLATAMRNGYRDGWAAHRYHEAFGVWPRGFVWRARVRARFERLLNARA